MNVRTEPAVNAAIRTLDEGERQKVFAWLDHLKNWEGDAHVRKLSRPTAQEGVYVLNTSDDLRLFFELDLSAGEITVIDLAKPSRFANVPVMG